MLGQGLWCHWHTWILGTVSTPLSLPRPWLPLFSLLSCLSFLTIFSQTETVETDLQAGANYRYEVHFQCVPKAHKILLLTFMILHFFVLPPWPMYSSYQIFKTFIPEDLRSQKSRTKLADFSGQKPNWMFALFFFNLLGVHLLQLLWVILIGLIFALIIQSLAANLGVVTGKFSNITWRKRHPVPSTD